MTVQELIDKLMKIKIKELPVLLQFDVKRYDNKSGYSCTGIDIGEVYAESTSDILGTYTHCYIGSTLEQINEKLDFTGYY